MDIATYNALGRGMPESEVLLRAGEPDLVTAPGGEVLARGAWGGAVLDTGPRIRFHYLPGRGEHDPWLTIITFTNGRVSALERRKLLGPVSVPPPPRVPGLDAARPAVRDEDIRRERAERTLEAAQRYSDVRARIKERAGETTPGPGREVYRGTDAEGTPYFGDRPPAEAKER
jgi:hypothetical protein